MADESRRYRWAEATFEEVRLFMWGGELEDLPRSFNYPAGEHPAGCLMLAFRGGGAVLACSRGYSKYADAWTKPPQFWIGEPD